MTTNKNRMMTSVSLFLVAICFICTGCPSTSKPAVTLGNYDIIVEPFVNPPQNFNFAACQANFNFPSSTPIAWVDLWQNGWYILINAQTAQGSNPWNETYQGCGKNGNAVFTTTTVNYPFSVSDVYKLRIQLPTDRDILISCSITSICGNCNTTLSSTVSYTWTTNQVPFTMSNVSPSIPLDLGPLSDVAQINLPNGTNPICPCQ